jgi:hypothetical protein
MPLKCHHWIVRSLSCNAHCTECWVCKLMFDGHLQSQIFRLLLRMYLFYSSSLRSLFVHDNSTESAISAANDCQSSLLVTTAGAFARTVLVSRYLATGSGWCN